MRTVSAAELSRLAGGRGAKVSMALPAEPAPSPAPPPPPNNDKLADAVLQLGSLLAGALQQFAKPPPAPQPAPAPAPEPSIWDVGVLPQMAMQRQEPTLVGRFVVKTDSDGLVLSIAAGDATYEIQRDEDGAGERIVRRSGSSTTSYRIERGRGGRITGAVKIT